MSASRLPGGGMSTFTGNDKEVWLVDDRVIVGGSMIAVRGRALRESETTTTPAVVSAVSSLMRASFV
jgi:hypothetical protein